MIYDVEDYALLDHTTSEDLNKEVSTYLSKGWQPYGSPFSNSDGWYVQAMVKWEDPKETEEDYT